MPGSTAPPLPTPPPHFPPTKALDALLGRGPTKDARAARLEAEARRRSGGGGGGEEGGEDEDGVEWADHDSDSDSDWDVEAELR